MAVQVCLQMTTNIATPAAAALEGIQFPKEWHLWKAKHDKMYESTKHELSKHLVWLSNKKYIDEHNKHANVLGYGLAMNQFGDMVST